MNTDNTPSPKQQPAPKTMGYEQFCSKNGLSQYEKFYLEKRFKLSKLSETEWKKKIKQANGN